MGDDAAAMRRVLMDTVARAIDETRARMDGHNLEAVLIQLEDIDARLRTRADLDDDYRKSLSFHVTALR